MDPRSLLVSDPPHNEVDPISAAPHFHLTAAEVRMKAAYKVPEIWFAQEDRAALEETAAALTEAGLRTVVVESSDLVDIPPQSPAVSVAFEDDGLCIDGNGSERMVAYDTPAIAVFGRPHPSEGQAQRTGTSISAQLSSRGRLRRRTPNLGAEEGASDFSAFLDLYLPSDEGLRRISIVNGVTDVSALPQDLAGPFGIFNVVKECEARFHNAHFDRRLVDMRLRGVRLVVPPGSPHRTGFSYATTALAELLGSLSPNLGDASHPDLSSGLAYLTVRSRMA